MMKKFIYMFVAVALLFSCSKDEDTVSLSDLKLNFYNVSSTAAIFIDGRATDQQITFDVFVAKPAPKDIVITLSKGAESTIKDSQFSLSATELTIPAGQLKASAAIDFLYDGFVKDESTTLLVSVSSNDVEQGFNSTLEISAGKIGNPLKDVFPGDYQGWYWNPDETVGDYDQGWDSPITLTFDETDPTASTMLMNNLWWGGEDLVVVFDLDNGTIFMEGGLTLDAGWDSDPYFAPWHITEVTGTFDIAGKKLVFDYAVYDVNDQYYNTYTAWVTPVTSKIEEPMVHPQKR